MAKVKDPKEKEKWLQLLQSAVAAKADEVPEDFKPIEHWLKEYRISENTWLRRIPIFIESGKFVRGEYRILKNGRLVKRPFWKATSPLS